MYEKSKQEEKEMDKNKVNEWKARIGEIEKNGDSITGYCRKYSISVHEGYYWKKKILKLQLLPEKDSITEIVFASEKKGTSGLKVSFSNGIEIIPEKGFSEYDFLRVVSLVRSL